MCCGARETRCLRTCIDAECSRSPTRMTPTRWPRARPPQSQARHLRQAPEWRRGKLPLMHQAMKMERRAGGKRPGCWSHGRRRLVDTRRRLLRGETRPPRHAQRTHLGRTPSVGDRAAPCHSAEDSAWTGPWIPAPPESHKELPRPRIGQRVHELDIRLARSELRKAPAKGVGNPRAFAAAKSASAR